MIKKKEETTVFSVVHDQRALSQIVLGLEMKNQRLKFVAVIAMNTDRLPVPVNPNRHTNTINRCGVVGSG